MTHFCSVRVTHTENTIWNRNLPTGKSGGIIIHAAGVRLAVPSSAPEARKVLYSQRDVRSRTMPPPRPVFLKSWMPSLARWQKALARRQPVPVYKWCWVTFGEQSRVIFLASAEEVELHAW